MSSLPPDASNAPQPADSEPDDSAALPRWAVPAVPPPWAGTGQAAPGGQPPADLTNPAWPNVRCVRAEAAPASAGYQVGSDTVLDTRTGRGLTSFSLIAMTV